MKYTVTATLTIGVFTDIEADSEAEAIEKAEAERSPTMLCHQCGGDPATEWALCDGLESVPENIAAYEAD